MPAKKVMQIGSKPGNRATRTHRHGLRSSQSPNARALLLGARARECSRVWCVSVIVTTSTLYCKYPTLRLLCCHVHNEHHTSILPQSLIRAANLANTEAWTILRWQQHQGNSSSSNDVDAKQTGRKSATAPGAGSCDTCAAAANSTDLQLLAQVQRLEKQLFGKSDGWRGVWCLNVLSSISHLCL